jgi:hypothetical protein
MLAAASMMTALRILRPEPPELVYQVVVSTGLLQLLDVMV